MAAAEDLERGSAAAGSAVAVDSAVGPEAAAVVAEEAGKAVGWVAGVAAEGEAGSVGVRTQTAAVRPHHLSLHGGEPI